MKKFWLVALVFFGFLAALTASARADTIITFNESPFVGLSEGSALHNVGNISFGGNWSFLRLSVDVAGVPQPAPTPPGTTSRIALFNGSGSVDFGGEIFLKDFFLSSFGLTIITGYKAGGSVFITDYGSAFTGEITVNKCLDYLVVETDTAAGLDSLHFGDCPPVPIPPTVLLLGSGLLGLLGMRKLSSRR